MEKKLLIIFCIIFSIGITAQVHVSGYTRSNGTYVEPHMRSSPNLTPTDNYSYPGNTNPYTGKIASGNPDTYLKNYNSYDPFDSHNRFDNLNSYSRVASAINIESNFPKAHVITSTLKVRSSPSKKSNIISSIFNGESIDVLSTTNPNWTKVRISYFDFNRNKYRYRIGYVHSSCISQLDPTFNTDSELSKSIERILNSNSQFSSGQP